MRRGLVGKVLVVSVVVLLCGVVAMLNPTGGVVGFLGSGGFGTTLYVGGSGPGNYSSIQAAIDNASDGDTVFVYSGVYYENVVVDKSINLVGEDRDTTIIDGGGSGDTVRIIVGWVNISGFSFTNSGTTKFEDAGLEISHTSDCSVKNCSSFSNGYAGIRLNYVSNSRIFNCSVYNNLGAGNPGIYLRYSSNIQIVHCICHNNVGGIRVDHDCDHVNIVNCTTYNHVVNGIILTQGANNNTIDGCVSYNNGVNGAGISLNIGLMGPSPRDNKVINCILYDNHIGIYLKSSYNNIMFNNSIYQNSEYGIKIVDSSKDNKIYHNNFINNTIQAYDSGNNVWDDGYPSGGNYWSDYNGTDENGDGIGDTPYDIAGGNNQDRYPLMHPVTRPPVFVWVDDDYNSSIPFWGFDHFNKIQDGINAVAEGGTVYVFNGTYYENVVVNKTIHLVGENRDGTIIDGNNNKVHVVEIIANNVSFENFTVRNSRKTSWKDTGLWISSKNCLISDCNFYINMLGVYGYGALHTRMINCISHDNANMGMRFDYGAYNSIRHCKAYNNPYKGIKIEDEEYDEVANCIIYGNWDGLRLTGQNSSIHDNRIYNNRIGIIFHGGSPTSKDNKIYNNIIRDNSEYGIIVKSVNAQRNKIYHNSLINNAQNANDPYANSWDDGYPSGGNYWSDFDEPSEGAYDNNSDGIVDSPYYIPGGGNVDRYPLIHPWNWTAPIPSIVYVDDNFNSSTPGWNYDHFDGIQDGIDAVAENGTVYVYRGIYYENLVVNKSINLIGEDKDNTIIDAKGNGSSYHNAVIWVYYPNWTNISGFTVTNASTGIAVANSTTQVRIRNCIIKDCTGFAGIFINWNPYSSIENCSCHNNSGYGIFFDLGYQSSIRNCTVFNNGNGIGLAGTIFFNVTNCTIFNNDGIGIYLTPSGGGGAGDVYLFNNTITDCNISNNSYGIKIQKTGMDNYIYDNQIYHNNFINNNVQNAYDEGDDIWDNGYPSGGNYWSDYTGVDYYHGPNQDIPGGDGIGDTSYYIPGGNNVDRYPFMKPNGWLDTTPPVTTKIIGDPKYGSNDEWATSHTEFNLTAIDDVSGVDATYYRIWYNYSWTPWIEYTGNFTLNGEGKHYLEYYSVDNAGNIEEVHNQTHYVDDSPPTTFKEYGGPYYRDEEKEWITSYTPIYLNTIDNPTCSPSGVNNTWYKIDNGEWMLYTHPFFIQGECQHIIYFYSNDHLGNTEKMKNQTVYVDNTPPVSNITISEPKFNWTEFLLEQLIRYIPPEIRDIYNSLPIFVTNHTHLRPQAQDQGECRVGVGEIYYRTWNTFDGWTEWKEYEEKQKPIDIAKPGFTLERQGPNHIEYYSQDLLRNKEKTVHNQSCIVDDTPPTTEAFGYNPIILKTTEHGGKHASKNPMENTLEEFPPVGLFYIHYRYKIGENGVWTNWFTSELQYFTGYVTITHNSVLDPIYVDYYAVDILGNMEEMHHDVFTNKAKPGPPTR